VTVSARVWGARRVRFLGTDAVGFRGFQPAAHGSATTLAPQAGLKVAPEVPEELTRGALDGVAEGVVQQVSTQATVRVAD
jgi:hypothetical protein